MIRLSMYMFGQNTKEVNLCSFQSTTPKTDYIYFSQNGNVNFYHLAKWYLESFSNLKLINEYFYHN